MAKLRFHRKHYHDAQWEFLTCEEEIYSFVGGLGSGKTFVLLRKILAKHTDNRPEKTNKRGRTHGLVVYPTYGLAEELFVGPFCELLESRNIRYTYNISKHRLTTRYGTINVYQLATPQRIVGSSYTFAAFDEFDVGSWKNCELAFNKTVGRMRGCAGPEIFFVTSPEGHHYTYKIFVTDNRDGSRKMFRAKTTDNPHLPEGYVLLMEKNFDPRLLRAYRDGDFVNLTQGQMYYAFTNDAVCDIPIIRETDRESGGPSINWKLPVVVMADFNSSKKPMAWNVGQQHGDDVYIRWSLNKTYTNTFEMCDYLESVLVKAAGSLPKVMYFYGDYSGNKTTSNSSKSDWQIIEEHFRAKQVKVVVLTKPTRSVKDGVNAVNGRFAHGKIKIHSGDECEYLREDLDLTVWDESGMKEDQSDDMRSHAVSALRYFIDYEFPFVQRVRRTG